MKSFLKLMPWLFLGLFATEVAVVMLPKKEKTEYNVREFARLPVLLNGRIQPMDSVGNNSLLQIRSTSDVPLEIVPSWKFWQHAQKLKASEWLLETMTVPELADTRPIFLIHHPDLLSELKIQDKGLEHSGLRYYTFNELQPVISEILKQAGQIEESKIKPELQTHYQRQLLKLANAVVLYQRLKNTLVPMGSTDFGTELQNFKRDIATLRAQANAGKGEQDMDPELLRRVEPTFLRLQNMGRTAHVLNIPPLDPEASRDGWVSSGASLDPTKTLEIHPAVAAYIRIATAYAQKNPTEFNQAIADYQQWLKPNFAKEIKKGRNEFYYNDVKAFLHATIMYIFALVLAGTALLSYTIAPNLSESLRRSAFYVILLAGVVHTFGLVFRMVLEGRPPVTNLYSSAIFIGWGAVILGVVLERIYRIGIGNVVASTVGFITLLIAHNLALGGDTMEMMRAVLDTNVWLATHVVVVTLGYASTFVAGFLAICYIFLGHFTPMLSDPISKRQVSALTAVGATAGFMAGGVVGSVVAGKAVASGLSKQTGQITVGAALNKMVYGIICFATLASFVGTILGGIWADQSWGRFWGWDPKENGALMIVLWNATILHFRWGGMVKERGLMNLAIVGNIITSFSWFGVNMLGIGLHAYGFMDAAFGWLVGFVISQLVIIAVGLIPLKYWKSFRGKKLPATPVPDAENEKAPKSKPTVGKPKLA